MRQQTCKMSVSFIAVVTLVLTAGAAQAVTWDGGGGANHDWTTAANWAGDAVPAAGGNNDVATGYADITTAVVGNRLDIKNAAVNLTSGGTLNMDWGIVLNEVNGGGSGGTYNWAGTMNAVGRANGLTPFLYNWSGSGTAAVNISGSASGGFWWWQIGRDADTIFTLSVTGSNATPRGYYLNLSANSVMKYIFDSSGISPITMSGSGVLADAAIALDSTQDSMTPGGNLVIDLAAYTGGDNTFTLLAGPTGALKVGEVFNSVTIQNAGAYIATVNYGSGGTGTGDVTVTIAVPEPATMALLAIGGLGMLIRRRHG